MTRNAMQTRMLCSEEEWLRWLKVTRIAVRWAVGGGMAQMMEE